MEKRTDEEWREQAKAVKRHGKDEDLIDNVGYGSITFDSQISFVEWILMMENVPLQFDKFATLISRGMKLLNNMQIIYIDILLYKLFMVL